MSKTPEWRIGCSGYQYKEWRDFFYPDHLIQKNWFSFYAQRFNTVEINNSFYQFPRLPALQNWFQNSPDDFIFSIKVPRLITHYKKFNGTETMLKEFYDVVLHGLGKKLGAVLFQLPPQVNYNQLMLQKIIDALDPSFTNVVEFRHPSWWKEVVYEKLGNSNIVFCGSSHPKLPNDVIVNTPLVYYRFHGVPTLFYSAYDEDFIEAKAMEASADNRERRIYFYFNNTAGPGALKNAQHLQKFLGLQPLPARV